MKVMNRIKMKVIYLDQWSVKTTKQHPSWLFLFGDNDKGIGKRGQAVIRGEPNAMGIPTKKLPRFCSSAFYKDEEYDDNCKKIGAALDRIATRLQEGIFDVVVLSSGGLGTGLAELDVRAPQTHQFLCEILQNFLNHVINA